MKTLRDWSDQRTLHRTPVILEEDEFHTYRFEPGTEHDDLSVIDKRDRASYRFIVDKVENAVWENGDQGVCYKYVIADVLNSLWWLVRNITKRRHPLVAHTARQLTLG